MNRIISDELKMQLRDFFKSRPDVAAVYIFGSYGTQYQHNHSDIDLGVVFSNPVSFQEELKIDAKLSLAVATDKEIDFVNLKRAPIPLQFRALYEGILIYEGDYLFHSNFIERVLKMHYEYQLQFHEYKYVSEEKEGDSGGR